MVKIIFFSDSHLGFDFPIKPKLDIRRRGEDFFRNNETVLNYAVNNNADLIIHGGDYFFRTKVPQRIVDLAYDQLQKYAEFGIPIIILPGNHESSRLPVSIFTSHKNLFIFSKPSCFSFDINNKKVNIYGFPFFRGDVRTAFPKIVEDFHISKSENNINLLLLHQAIDGSKVGPADFTFANNEDVINIKNIPDSVDSVLSGHIHRHQILYTKSGTPIIYPGSIERTSFAEKDEIKGFCELILNGNEIPLVNFIELDTRPMIDSNIDLDTSDSQEIYEYLKKLFISLHRDAIIRLSFNYSTTRDNITAKLLRNASLPTQTVMLKGGFRESQNYKKARKKLSAIKK